jgi:hypothetical protein
VPFMVLWKLHTPWVYKGCVTEELQNWESELGSWKNKMVKNTSSQDSRLVASWRDSEQGGVLGSVFRLQEIKKIKLQQPGLSYSSTQLWTTHCFFFQDSLSNSQKW